MKPLVFGLMVLFAVSSFSQVKTTGGKGPDEDKSGKWEKIAAGIEQLEDEFVAKEKIQWVSCYGGEASFSNLLTFSQKLILKQNFDVSAQIPSKKSCESGTSPGWKACLYSKNTSSTLSKILNHSSIIKYFQTKYSISPEEAKSLRDFLMVSLPRSKAE